MASNAPIGPPQEVTKPALRAKRAPRASKLTDAAVKHSAGLAEPVQRVSAVQQ